MDQAVELFYASLPKRRMGAGVLFVDDRGRPLLVEPTYKATWEIPGGGVEAGEDPRSCAVREIQEELGLDITLGRLLVIDHNSEPPPHGDSIMLVYEGGVMTDPGTIRLNEAELRSCRFTPVDELGECLSASMAHRIRQALDASRLGTTIEIVNGRVS